MSIDTVVILKYVDDQFDSIKKQIDDNQNLVELGIIEDGDFEVAEDYYDESELERVLENNSYVYYYPGMDCHIKFLLRYLNKKGATFDGNSAFLNETKVVFPFGPELVEDILDKSRFYKRFKDELPLPDSLIVEGDDSQSFDTDEIRNFFEKHESVLRKKKFGSGGEGLNETTFERVNEKYGFDPEESFLQEYVKGEDFSLDVVVKGGPKGGVKFVAYRGALSMEDGLISVAKVIPDHQPGIELANQIYHALDFRNKKGNFVFTVDGRETKNGMKILEINLRIGGGSIADFDDVSGEEIPFLKILLELERGESLENNYSLKQGLAGIWLDRENRERCVRFIPMELDEMDNFEKTCYDYVGKQVVVNGQKRYLLGFSNDDCRKGFILSKEDPNLDKPILHELFYRNTLGLVESLEGEILWFGGVTNRTPKHQFYAFKQDKYDLKTVEGYSYTSTLGPSEFSYGELEKYDCFYVNSTPVRVIRANNCFYLVTNKKAKESGNLDDLDSDSEILYYSGSHFNFTVSSRDGEILYQSFNYKIRELDFVDLSENRWDGEDIIERFNEKKDLCY